MPNGNRDNHGREYDSYQPVAEKTYSPITRNYQPVMPVVSDQAKPPVGDSGLPVARINSPSAPAASNNNGSSGTK